MKIGIDISQIVYQTGVSRYTAKLVENLLKIDNQNQYFLYAGSLRQKPIINSFLNQVKTKQVTSKVTNLSPKLADFFWNRFNLFSPDAHQDLDVFHASNWALPKTKTSLVTTIHDLTFLKFPRTHTPSSIKTHTLHLNRSKKFADLIITDSISTKKDLIDYGFKEAKIKVISLAPAPIFKPQKDQKKITQTLDKYHIRKPFILSVGTKEPRKNLKNLIKAYQKLSNSNTKLVIVGKFGWGEAIKPVFGVKLLGFIPDQDLRSLYSAAKVFVYPSLYEGFGFPVLEAFSCACPVITSNTSSLSEIGGEAALYVNPKSIKDLSTAIAKVLHLSGLDYQKLVAKSLKQVRKFSWDKTAKETLKVYREAATC